MMKKIRRLFAGTKTEDSSQPSSSRPLLTPGVYGRFPDVFSVSFAWHSDNRSSSTYFLVDETLDGSNGSSSSSSQGVRGNASEQTVRRLYAFVVERQRRTRHSLTLLAGTNVDGGSPPLALAGAGSTSTSVVALPGAPGAVSDKRVETLHHDGTLRSGLKRFLFRVAVGDGDGDGDGAEEPFEWHIATATGRGGRLAPLVLEHRLLRMESPAMGGTAELVGLWTDDASPMRGNRLGAFEFAGSGKERGEMGGYWRLMAVVSLLRILEIRSAAGTVSGMARNVGWLGGIGLV